MKKDPEYREVDISNGTKVNDFFFQLYVMIYLILIHFQSTDLYQLIYIK